MHEKLLKIHRIPMEEEERFMEEMTRWDEELEELMKAAEKKSVKKKNVNDEIDWSPYVGCGSNAGQRCCG